MRLKTVVVLFAATLVACGTPSGDVPGDSTTPTTSFPSTTARTGTVPREVIADVKADASARFSQPEGEIEVESAEPTPRDSTPTPCGEGGEGFTVTLRIVDHRYWMQAVEGEEGLAICVVDDAPVTVPDDPDTVSRDGGGDVPVTIAGMPADLLDRIIDDAAARASVQRDSVSVDSVSDETFNDASLGCPEKGVVYIQVMTPGWVVHVEAGSAVLEYHAATSGAFVLCSTGS